MAGKTIDQTGAEVSGPGARTLVPADRQAVLEAAASLLALIPDAPDDDGSAILSRLLSAEGWEDLNSQGRLPNGKDVAGPELVVRDLVRRPTELEPDEDGTVIKLDYYLVVDSVTLGRGTELRWQTSAPALVFPLAKLYVWRKLPAVVQVKQSDKATRRGFRPLNLTVLSVNAD